MMAEKSKVLLVGPIAPELGGTAVGGIANHMQELAYVLMNNGHSVGVMYFSQTKSYEINGINVYGCSAWKKPFFSILGLVLHPKILTLQHLTFLEKIFFSEFHLALKRVLKRNSFDVIHVHSLHNVATTVYSFQTNFPPLIITDHGAWHGVDASTNKERVILKLNRHAAHAQKVICISEHSKKKLQTFIATKNNQKLVNIPNPIDFGAVSEYSKKKGRAHFGFGVDEKLILFNGINKSVSIKGVDLLIKALEPMDLDITVIAIADVEGQSLIKKELKQEYKLFSRMSREELSILYRSVDLVVVPSRGESFGLIYVEALAHDTIPIGFSPLMAEFNKALGQEAGIGFDPTNDSIEDLSHAITDGLSRIESLQGIGDDVRNYYSWSLQVKSFLKVYQEAQADL